MHNQRGREHRDVIGDIGAGRCKSAMCAANNVDLSQALDPGFGFGWTVEQNLRFSAVSMS